MLDKKEIYTSVNLRFIETFKLIQKSHFLKRQELCDRLGVAYSNMSKFEKGERHVDLANVVNMFKVFGVSPYYLLLGVGQIFTPEAERELLLNLDKNAKKRAELVIAMRERMSDLLDARAQERKGEKGTLISQQVQEASTLRKEVDLLRSQLQDKDLIIQLLKSKLNMS